MSQTNQLASFGTALPGLEVRGNVGRYLRAVVGTVQLWRRRARDRRTLQSLDDQLLRDIGLSRADVEAEARKPFWRAESLRSGL